MRHTLTSVRSEINKIVAEKGADFVYKRPDNSIRCSYVHQDGPGCIVGHWMAKVGIEVPETKNSHPVTDLICDGFFGDVTEAAEKFLRELQYSQDDGATWGDALRSANAAVR